MEEDQEEQDLDQLLDEVERRFCRNVSVASSSKCVKDRDGERKSSVTKPEQPVNSITEDIDALLEELLEQDDSDSPQQKTKLSPKAEKKLSSQSGGRKCCPVFIGGSSVPSGVGTAMSKRSCDRLRCTSCDFWVLMFNDCEWYASCDYLFLRNNMPDRQKLQSRLKRRRGFRAYSCQCSWTSTSETTDLRHRPETRWVCGKHLDP